MRGLAFRRAQERRKKQKVKQYHGGWSGSSPRATGLAARSPQMCSCRGCGNRRKYEGPTIQEQRLRGRRRRLR
jgi:hypothetical protein